ncbi:MAG: cytochrome c biogenesis protein CcsA [bacterium]
MGLEVPGQLFILFALGTNILAGIGFFLLARGRESYAGVAQLSYRIFTVSVILAAAWLYYLLFSHNFAFKYVYEYSSTDLEFGYLVSSFWGGQEGTYLLWLLMHSFFGYIILNKGGRYANWGMVTLASVNFFLLLILTKLSPFQLLNGVPSEGLGLNPLLQNYWMVIHPPIMFIGFSMAVVPFSIVIAALIKNDYTSLIKRVFPWVAVTAVFLGAGNILGGYWAYETLGWGGYWAWDPVENTSLIPWLVSLALLHGMIIEKRSGALRKTNIIMTAMVFLLVVYGTFLTRSGVLADFSVHSFVDLGTNIYLVLYILFFVVLTLGLFLFRIRSLKSTPINYNFFGKEFSLFAGMLLLFLFGMIVLFWASLPFTTQAFGLTPRAAEIETYNSFAVPFSILYSFLMILSAFVTFKPIVPKNWFIKTIALIIATAGISTVMTLLSPDPDFVFVIVFTMVATGMGMIVLTKELVMYIIPALIGFVATVIICLLADVSQHIYILYFAMAAACIVANVTAFIKIARKNILFTGGMIAHFGFGFMLIGILSSSAFVTNQRLVLVKSYSIEAFGLNITYNGMASEITHPKNELLIEIDDHGSIEQARPQLYFSERMNGIMKRPYIKKNLLNDIYFSPQQIEEGDDSQQGILLPPDEVITAKEYKFKFLGFNMGDHGEEDAVITANVEVSYNDITDTISPKIIMGLDDQGKSKLSYESAFFGVGQLLEATIMQVLADQKAVVLDIPGLSGNQNPEKLILDVSKKPIINFVWFGTTLLVIGLVIVFFKRRKELTYS